jgi:hypothetical protein
MNKIALIALAVVSFGMLSMDAPKLSKRKIYDGITVAMPENFVVMSDNDIAGRYPSTKKPLAMFISEDTKADFGVNSSKAKFAQQDVNMLYAVYRATIIDTYDTTSAPGDNPFRREPVKKSFKFISEGIKTINKKEYAYFEYTSEFQNVKKYNYIMYTPHKKHVVIFNFSCDLRMMNIYQPIAQAMMNSVKVSKKTDLPDYTLQQNNLVPRKRQSAEDILEMQNKNKNKTK